MIVFRFELTNDRGERETVNACGHSKADMWHDLANKIDEIEKQDNCMIDAIVFNVCGYMFLAQSNDYAICCAEMMHIGDDVDETLDYHAQETREGYGTDLCVFPIEDCYRSKENADGAMSEELDAMEENDA